MLYGTLSELDIDRIRTLFMESSLPLRVDVCAYDQMQASPLRAHIDRVMRPLFQGDGLVSADCASPIRAMTGAEGTRG